jgi:hypothetical protein
MNKLLRPSLLAFTAFLTIVLASCSGSDGKSGGEGAPGSWANCSTALEGESVVVKCGETTIGVLVPGGTGGPGAPGGHQPVCTAEPVAEGYLITCPGSPSITINGGSAEGGKCVLTDTENLLTITCQRNNFRLTLCGSGTTGWYGENAKRSTFNENSHFCSSDFVGLDAEGAKKEEYTNNYCDITSGEKCKEIILPRCGGAASAGGLVGEAYDPTTKYCGRSLIADVTRVVNGKYIGTDDIASAGLWDVDAVRPWSANWKVLDLGDASVTPPVLQKCFVAGGDVKPCYSADITVSNYGAEGNLASYKEAVGSSSSASSIERMSGKLYENVAFCAEGYFYNRTEGKCTIAYTTTEEGDQCRSILAADNTCFSAENPSSTGAILAKSCFPMFGSQEDPARAANVKIWYDPATVASCNPVRRTLVSALTCASASSRQVSTWQAMDASIFNNAENSKADSAKLVNWIGLNLPEGDYDVVIPAWKLTLTELPDPLTFPGFTGKEYYKKVSCYESKAATDCGTAVSDAFKAYNLDNPTSLLVAPSASSISYISSTSDNRFGFCAFSASSVACPSASSTVNKYEVKNKLTIFNACSDWALNTSESTLIGDGTATFGQVLAAFSATRTAKNTLGGGTSRQMFATAFGLACADSASVATENQRETPYQYLQGTRYACNIGSIGSIVKVAEISNDKDASIAAGEGRWALDETGWQSYDIYEADGVTLKETVNISGAVPALVEVCNQFYDYYTNRSKYCILNIASAESTCYPGSAPHSTDKNRCVLSNTIVPAPVNDFRITYSPNTLVTEFTATPNALMCPHNDYDSKTGYCAVDPNRKKPECFKGYVPSPGNVRCEYEPKHSDCPFGFIWHSTRLVCVKTTAAGEQVQGAICPHNMTGVGTDAYSVVSTTTPRGADHGLCIETITRKHCPKGTDLVRPADRVSGGIADPISVDNPILCDYTGAGDDVLPGFISNNLYPAPQPDCLKGDTLNLSSDMKNTNPDEEIAGALGDDTQRGSTAAIAANDNFVCRVKLPLGNGSKLCKLNSPVVPKDEAAKVATYTNSLTEAGSCELVYSLGGSGQAGSVVCPLGGTFDRFASTTTGGNLISNVWPRCQINLETTAGAASKYCPVSLVGQFKSECRITCTEEAPADPKDKIHGRTFDPTHLGYAIGSDCSRENALNERAVTEAQLGACTGALDYEQFNNYASCSIDEAYSVPACEAGTERNPFNNRCEKL